MHADRSSEEGRVCDQGPHLTRDGDADCVGQEDCRGALGDDPLCNGDHTGGVYAAFEGTSECDGDRHRHTPPILLCAGDHVPRLCDRFVDAYALISGIEGLCGGEREVHFVELGRAETLVSALVQDKPRVPNTRAPLDGGGDLLGPGHGGHTPRIDKARRFHLRQSGSCEAVHEFRANRWR